MELKRHLRAAPHSRGGLECDDAIRSMSSGLNYPPGRRATYGQIQLYCHSHFGFTPPTCWIADVLNDLGLTRRQAPNRKDPSTPAKPCPDSKRQAIVEAITRAGSQNWNSAALRTRQGIVRATGKCVGFASRGR